MRQQIFISGIGGQGILLITRLLAEAVIKKNIPVLTAETHGMAQRGGTVTSHFKAGDFISPMIRMGLADGALILKSENLSSHADYVKPNGWIVLNSSTISTYTNGRQIFSIDADNIAMLKGFAKSSNLILLTYAAIAIKDFICTVSDIKESVEHIFKGKKTALLSSLSAIEYTERSFKC